MNDYLLNLNDRQLQAVTTKNQYVRVIAGAGSGKTRVLTTRILYLIDQWGIPSPQAGPVGLEYAFILASEDCGEEPQTLSCRNQPAYFQSFQVSRP